MGWLGTQREEGGGSEINRRAVKTRIEKCVEK